MQAWRRIGHAVINAIVNNALLHSNSRIKQMPPQIIRILRFLWYTRCPRFYNECTEARAVRWPEVWKFYGSLTLLQFPTGGANDAQNVNVDTQFVEKITTRRITKKR